MMNAQMIVDLLFVVMELKKEQNSVMMATI